MTICVKHLKDNGFPIGGIGPPRQQYRPHPGMGTLPQRGDGRLGHRQGRYGRSGRLLHRRRSSRTR
ncbi:MAG: hypothetical protein MZU91_00415 [Desulfosudis oleivorans]|nr:hypothetical protein [Desulfosudis oleivorans]